jgi:hypothetical protein
MRAVPLKQQPHLVVNTFYVNVKFFDFFHQITPKLLSNTKIHMSFDVGKCCYVGGRLMVG